MRRTIYRAMIAGGLAGVAAALFMSDVALQHDAQGEVSGDLGFLIAIALSWFVVTFPVAALCWGAGEAAAAIVRRLRSRR